MASRYNFTLFMLKCTVQSYLFWQISINNIQFWNIVSGNSVTCRLLWRPRSPSTSLELSLCLTLFTLWLVKPIDRTWNVTWYLQLILVIQLQQSLCNQFEMAIIKKFVIFLFTFRSILPEVGVILPKNNNNFEFWFKFLAGN